MDPEMMPCQEDEFNSSRPEIPIEEYFRYHAPDTEERKAKHEAVNSNALALALALDAASKAIDDLMRAVQKNVYDPDCRMQAFEVARELHELFSFKKYLFIVQQIRMFANQGITIDALRDKIEKKPSRLKIQVSPAIGKIYPTPEEEEDLDKPLT